MASAIPKKSCVKCPKGPGQAMCDGCEQYFCVKHFLEHRQELNQQMEALTLEHDHIQQDLTGEEHEHQHPLISRVDRWESKSIERIKQVANKIRLELRKSIDEMKKNIQKSLGDITKELQENRQAETFTELDLKKWMDQLKELKQQLEKPSTIEIQNDEHEVSSTHLPLIKLRVIGHHRVPLQISDKTRWSKNGQTVAGGHGVGNELNQLRQPFGVDVDNDRTIYVADYMNDRIMRWKLNATHGEVIAGGKGKGNRTDQLDRRVALLIDRNNRSLIISDEGNRRVMRWSYDKLQRNGGEVEVIIPNIISVGLAVDDEGSLYVSDFEKHEVRRHGRGDAREGVIVAGGNGRGDALNQLSSPRNIFVDAEYSVYISDLGSHRVVKWMRNAKEGVVVAGGQGKGNSLAQLSGPCGIFVDRMGSIYVADQVNHRLMRWSKGAKEGEIMVGGDGQGSNNNQLNLPANISLDHQGNLYVVDRDNHRIQRFHLQ